MNHRSYKVAAIVIAVLMVIGALVPLLGLWIH